MLFAVRTGIRANNDLAWIGKPANYAAKLSELREYPYSLFVTEAVYTAMHRDNKTANGGKSMWGSRYWPAHDLTIYRSSWMWPL
jgi:class 3 adenylate cyclase